MDGVERVREYYRTIDEDEYVALTRILAGGFVHRRPDMTIEGREEFVSFMKIARPDRETTHDVESIYLEADTGKVAVEGRLLDSDGEEWFRFVDTFEQVESGIKSVRTYTDLDTE